MIINKFSLGWLLNEADELDNGGGIDDNVDLDDGVEGDGTEEINLDNPGSVESPSGLNPDAIAEAVRRGFEGIIPEQRNGVRQNDQPQYTEEQRREFLKQMGRVEINDDLVTQLFGAGEPAVQQKRASVLQDLLDRTVQHALQIAGVAQNHYIAQLRQDYDPIVKLENQRRQEEFYGQVETAYPSLKGHGKVIKLVADKMIRDGYRSQGPEKDALALAVETARHIKQIQPEFTLKRAKSSGGRPGMPGMAASRSSAGGGVVQNGARKQPMSRAQALYFGGKK